MNKTISIILFYKVKDTAETIAGILRPHYPKIYPINIDGSLFGPFQDVAHTKVLFLFAIEEIEQAQMTCLTLYKSPEGEAIRRLPHCDFLLCKASDSKRAYELCDNGIFDDFGIMMPSFDNWALLYSIKRTIEHMELTEQLNACRNNSNIAAKKIGGFEKNLSAMAQRYGQAGQDHQQHIQQVMGQLQSSFDGCSKDFSGPEMGTILKVLDPDKLNAYLEKTRQSIIEEQLQPLLHNGEQLFQLLDDDIKVQQKGVNSARAKMANPVGHKGIIMVADDHRVMQEVVRSVFEAQGFQVIVAKDGVEALKKAVTQRPDLILMDIKMPNMDGLETVKSIKDNPELASIPVIMMTSFQDKGHIEQSLQAGAIDYIVKPTKGSILLEKVMRAIRDN